MIEKHTPLELYVTSLSLITETLSKVGYGNPFYPLTTIEMIFLIYVIIFNCASISLIFYQILHLKFD